LGVRSKAQVKHPNGGSGFSVGRVPHLMAMRGHALGGVDWINPLDAAV
jgi:hypothetical protein